MRQKRDKNRKLARNLRRLIDLRWPRPRTHANNFEKTLFFCFNLIDEEISNTPAQNESFYPFFHINNNSLDWLNLTQWGERIQWILTDRVSEWGRVRWRAHSDTFFLHVSHVHATSLMLLLYFKGSRGKLSRFSAHLAYNWRNFSVDRL